MAKPWGSRLRELEAEREARRADVAGCPHPDALCICAFELATTTDALRAEIRRVTQQQMDTMRELRGDDPTVPER